MSEVPNKMVSNRDVRKETFHFAGTGSHPPIAVEAWTQADAIEKYRGIVGGVTAKSPTPASDPADDIETD